VATNFDGASKAAIDAAASVARSGRCSIHVLCVLEALMYAVPEMAAWAERDPRTHPEVTRKLRETTSTLRAAGVEQVDASVEYGIAADVILRHASGGEFDLLVLGAGGHRGDVEAAVVARAKIPVIVVAPQRPPEASARDERGARTSDEVEPLERIRDAKLHHWRVSGSMARRKSP
jgi:nucleotide-binding universal stress UspA family protein